MPQKGLISVFTLGNSGIQFDKYVEVKGSHRFC